MDRRPADAAPRAPDRGRAERRLQHAAANPAPSVTTVSIIVVGVAIALTQFAAVNRAAAALLASGAIAAAVIGFAARSTLANAIAGILIAIAQPIRLGDLVTIEGETGVVEDVRLSYTFLRTADDVRIVIPNERLASSVIRNASIATVRVRTSLWLAADTDVGAALTALDAALPDSTPRIAETTPEGVRIALTGGSVSVGDRDRAESELLGSALRAVHANSGPPGRTTAAGDEPRS